jgi:hypothetical protein
MRIKLTTNSNVSLPAHLSNLDVGYGYSLINDEDNPLGSWQTKSASAIDKVLSFFKPLSNEQREIINSVTESVKFLNTHIPSSDEHLDNLSIQLNLKTPLNQGMRKVAKKINELGLPFSTNSLFQMIESNITMIFPEQKRMFLGEEAFNESAKGVVYALKNDIGLQKTVQFVVYHEAAHAFELTNVKNLGNKFDTIFHDIYENTKLITDNFALRNDLTKLIQENPEAGYFPICERYATEIKSLFSEIYGDVGGLLLQRNQDITEAKHSRENDLLNINSIISARNFEQKSTSNNSASGYINCFNHFTSPGLEYLKENCYQIPNRILTQEEIHTFAHKAIEQGISRVLIANSVANKENIEDLTTLFSINRNIDNNENVSLDLPAKANPNIYVDYMNKFKKFAGEEWVANFTKNIYIIHDQKIIDNKRATWHAAFYPNKFKEDLANNSTIKAQMDELFGITEELKQSVSEIILPTKEVVGLRVNGMLDKLRNSNNTNSNQFKPN